MARDKNSNFTIWELPRMNLAIRGANRFQQDLHPDLNPDFILAKQ